MDESEQAINPNVIGPFYTIRVGHGVVIAPGLNDPKVTIGYNVFIGHNTVIRDNVAIGDDVVIGHNTTIEDHVAIGNETRIQANCYITRDTTIHSKVFIGPCVCTTNDNHICSHGRPQFPLEGVTIHHGARIGARALLMPGVTIGKNAFVGAGSIVTKDVPERAIIHGDGTQAVITGEVPEEECV